MSILECSVVALVMVMRGTVLVSMISTPLSALLLVLYVVLVVVLYVVSAARIVLRGLVPSSH